MTSAAFSSNKRVCLLGGALTGVDGTAAALTGAGFAGAAFDAGAGCFAAGFFFCAVVRAAPAPERVGFAAAGFAVAPPARAAVDFDALLRDRDAATGAFLVATFFDVPRDAVVLACAGARFFAAVVPP